MSDGFKFVIYVLMSGVLLWGSAGFVVLDWNVFGWMTGARILLLTFSIFFGVMAMACGG